MSKQHTVREGDCISSIAFKYGFHPNTLWEHPENAGLREKRKEATVLLEGDVVFIPDLTIKQVTKPTEAKHVFKRKAIPDMLQIRFLDEDNKPRAGRIYNIIIDGSLRRGETDNDGFVKEPIPPNAVRAHLILYENFEKNEREEYDFSLGYLQPITELAGIQARLASLGYPTFGEDTLGEQTRQSISNFQTNFNMEPTGELDDQTRSKIKEVYGA
jgi:hypothetical protein